jgi:hypothetical protein
MNLGIEPKFSPLKGDDFTYRRLVKQSEVYIH